MKTIKIILGIIVSLAVIFALIYANYGGFSKVKFQVKEEGGEVMVYKEITGPYQKSGEVINKLHYNLMNDKIKTFKSIGVFYDDPKLVKSSMLHSEAGCILETADTSKVFWLRAKYDIKVCPVRKYIITEFPFKGKISILANLVKVYPALSKYVKENNYTVTGPIIEIYDMPGKIIRYRQELVSMSENK